MHFSLFYSYICRLKLNKINMFMRNNCRFIIFALIAILSLNQGVAQIRQYKHLPDFDYADYDKHLKFMSTPFAMVGQTLYLQDVPDSALNKFFFVGNIAIPEEGDDTGVRYYKLSRMSPERIQSLKGEWFVVADYIADQFAFAKIFNADEYMRDFTKMQYPFMKLVIGSTGDTVFYNYQNYLYPYTYYYFYHKNLLILISHKPNHPLHNQNHKSNLYIYL